MLIWWCVVVICFYYYIVSGFVSRRNVKVCLIYNMVFRMIFVNTVVIIWPNMAMRLYRVSQIKMNNRLVPSKVVSLR